MKIEFVNANQSRITIYDINGKVMLDQISTDNPIILNISNWERGTYNVKVTNTDTNETKIDLLILQ
ncbi:MAG: T9SS type A sorting domain-containing protein [Crocinitomicaceae bacterium]